MSATTLHLNGKPVTLEAVEKKADEIRFGLNGRNYHFRSHRLDDGSWLLEEETAPGVWLRLPGTAWAGAKNTRRIQLGALEATVTETPPGASSVAATLSPLAPMPGLVRQLLVKKGQQVKQGQALIMLEAMKLQITLSAGADAAVEAILVKEGQLVGEGAELVRLKAHSKR